MSKDITNKMLQEFNENYSNNANNKLMENIIISNGIKQIALNKDVVNRNSNLFSIELPKAKIENQKRSGRCWAFAGINIIKRKVAEKLNVNLETLELSQNYITFYDKLEKANNFYEAIIKFVDKDLLDRELLFILDNAMPAAGDWQFFIELVKKYGIVPKTIMPETKDSEESETLMRILSTKMKKDAIRLRGMLKDSLDMNEIRSIKQNMLQEVYGVLCKTLGQPPINFKYEYMDRNKKYNIIDHITPMEFYEKFVGDCLDEYVVVGNVPMFNKTFGKVYREKSYISNLVDKANRYFLNLEIKDVKNLILESLKNGEPVYFGSNVTKMASRELEIFNDELYQYDRILEIDLEMSKEELLDYREICFEHSMVFTGVNVNVNVLENKIDRWKVENSWGDDKQNRGVFVMHDNFFNKYVLECVINKKYFSEDQLTLLQQEPIMFDPWDPMH